LSLRCGPGRSAPPPTAASGTDAYSASKSEWVVLAEVFADLGTWWGATPFVGAGAGFAYKVTPGLTLELAYRYLILAAARAGI
jgi:opacity protein-like surface antigen